MSFDSEPGAPTSIDAVAAAVKRLFKGKRGKSHQDASLHAAEPYNEGSVVSPSGEQVSVGSTLQ